MFEEYVNNKSYTFLNEPYYFRYDPHYWAFLQRVQFRMPNAKVPYNTLVNLGFQPWFAEEMTSN